MSRQDRQPERSGLVKMAMRCVGLGAGVTGTVPSVNGKFLWQAGNQAVVFTAGAGTLTLPKAFPNGVLVAECTLADASIADVLIDRSGVGTTSTLALFGWRISTNVAFVGTVTVGYFTIGF